MPDAPFLQPGYFFTTKRVKREDIRVIVGGYERSDYKLFQEEGFSRRSLVFFEFLTNAEYCSLQIKYRPSRK